MSKEKKEVQAKKKADAYDLYIKTDMDIQDIAFFVKSNRKTVGGWIKDGGWKDIKEASKITNESLVAAMQKRLHDMITLGVPLYDKKTGSPLLDPQDKQLYRRATSDEISKENKSINDTKDNRVLMSHRYLTMKEFFHWHSGKFPKAAEERNRLADLSDAYIKDKLNGA